MAELRDLLDGRARQWRPAPEGWERLERRLRRRQRNRRLVSAALALVLFLAAFAAAWTAFRGRVAPANQPLPPIEVIHLAGPAYGVATGDGSAWAQVRVPLGAVGSSPSWAHSRAALERVDLATGRVLAVIPGGSALPPIPHGPARTAISALLPPAVGPGGAWVVRPLGRGRETIQRIDPATNRVAASLAVARPCCDAVVAGAAGVWTTAPTRTGELARLDPQTAHVVGGASLGQLSTTNLLAEGPGAVWAVAQTGTLVSQVRKTLLFRVSSDTGAIRAVAAPSNGGSMRLVVAAGSVWVGEGSDVLRLSAATGTPVATLKVPTVLLADLAYGAGSLWVLGGERSEHVWRVDPATGRVIATIPVPAGSISMAYGGGAIWVTNAGRDTLTRIAVPTCPGAGCPAPSPSPTPAGALGPAWFRSMRMVSPTVGWALAWSGNPGSSTPVFPEPVRTTDGGRTWKLVMPPAARPLLASPSAQAVLFGQDADHAWLAVSHSVGKQAMTTVFVTADAGRSWTASPPFSSLGDALGLTFVDPVHGWLLADRGAAMGWDAVAVLHSVDGGRSWSMVARTPRIDTTGGGASGLPSECDKTGIAFANSSTGWVTAACGGGPPYLYATHDGGLHWVSSAPALSVPASLCGQNGCAVSPVAGFGSTQVFMVGGYPAVSLLVTHHAGATWSLTGLPAGPTASDISFPDASHGFVLARPIPGERSGLLATGDGGRTWHQVVTDLPDAHALEASGALDFLSPAVGFAQNANATGPEPPPLFVTHDGGRTWTTVHPVLVR